MVTPSPVARVRTWGKKGHHTRCERRRDRAPARVMAGAGVEKEGVEWRVAAAPAETKGIYGL